jgi:hypothetical protein
MDNDWLKRWEAAEAQWVLNAAILIDLPTVATDAMVHGWDTQSLRLLTVASTGDDRDARDLFLAAVAELGRHLPTHSDAARRLVQFYAATIASGEVEPLTGARAIARLGYGSRNDIADEIQLDIATFDGLDDEWIGGWGRSRTEVEAHIKAEARALIDD